ncbi:hypothetical protein CXF68_02955 [Tenacibaculum sp. Bg11-29]|nr:hypothetical protein CXF68_02955 [Tenacibaculum sp. Bg11-29]
MKLIKPNQLLGYTIAFFISGFFQKKTQDNTPFYSFFNLLLFTFSSITISLFLFLIIYSEKQEHNFFNFLVLLSILTTYFIVRHLLDYFLSNILGLSLATKYFLVTKSGYLNSLSLWLFPFIIIYQYAFNNSLFLIIIFFILFIFRLFLILINNKKIVILKLFYFILYFCTLEIAPLLIAYKIITTT